MTDRILKLCSYLGKCKTFADVGCDHGYCALFALKNSLCERAVVSDVSAKCLSKAENLLKNYIKDGKCTPVCCYGLEKISRADLVLMAGMGGEEIVSVMKAAYIPENFVFQPMKNAQKLRVYLLENGAEITRDDVFISGGKFYFVLCGKREGGKSLYTPAQLKYGKGDLNGALGEYLREEISKKRALLGRGLNEESRIAVLNEAAFAERVLKGETE